MLTTVTLAVLPLRKGMQRRVNRLSLPGISRTLWFYSCMWAFAVILLTNVSVLKPSSHPCMYCASVNILYL